MKPLNRIQSSKNVDNRIRKLRFRKSELFTFDRPSGAWTKVQIINEFSNQNLYHQNFNDRNL